MFNEQTVVSNETYFIIVNILGDGTCLFATASISTPGWQ